MCPGLGQTIGTNLISLDHAHCSSSCKPLQELEAKSEAKFNRLKQQAKAKLSSMQEQLSVLQQTQKEGADGQLTQVGDRGEQVNMVTAFAYCLLLVIATC